jgi:hypothetical protein
MTAQPPRTHHPRTRPVGTVTFHRFLYLVSAIPLAGLWLALVIGGWALTAGLMITLLGVGVLFAFGVAVRFAGWTEGFLARRLLHAPTYPRRVAARPGSYWRAGFGTVHAAGFWRVQAFLLLRAVLGLITAAIPLAVLGAGLQGVAAPLIYRFIPMDGGAHGLDLGFWQADTIGEALLLVAPGAALVAAGLVLVNVFGSMWRRLAVGVLGGNND